MNENDRKFVESAREWPVPPPSKKSIEILVTIIDRLNKQLAKLKEAGKPFRVFTENQFGDSSDYEYPIFEEGDFTVGEFRRLAQALDKIEEVKDG